MRSVSSESTRRHVPAEKVRRALLDAGRELLFERGVEPGLGRVSLKDAITRAGVPRSSAYRIFSGDRGPLETFRFELLSDLEDTIAAQPTIDAAEQVLNDYASDIDSGDPRRMALALRELIRVALAVNIESIAASNEWHVFMSSLAAAGFEAQRDPALAELHQSAADNRRHRFIPVYQSISAMFGLRLRAPLSWDDFAACVIMTSDSAGLRFDLERRLRELPRPTGPRGEVQPWNGGALAFEGLVMGLLEPDPDASASADLTVWLETVDGH